jgi:hypothetical protein
VYASRFGIGILVQDSNFLRPSAAIAEGTLTFFSAAFYGEGGGGGPEAPRPRGGPVYSSVPPVTGVDGKLFQK